MQPVTRFVAMRQTAPTAPLRAIRSGRPADRAVDVYRAAARMAFGACVRGMPSTMWPGVKTAVNVSATQLQTPGFVDKVKAIVADVGADPKLIEIELTEGVLYTNEQLMRDALSALHDAGFSIALDDFGTGYSSLSYLPRFPIDKIKIDRSFVAELGHDAKSDALFGAIVRLAQTLEMRVIAEGVETHEQWLRLSAAGCPKVQGYVTSKPLSADEVYRFIQSSHEVDLAHYEKAPRAERNLVVVKS